MTTRERVMAALAGREANRVPLAVWMHNFASETSAHALAAETPTKSGPGSESGISLHAIETHHDSKPFHLGDMTMKVLCISKWAKAPSPEERDAILPKEVPAT